MKKKKKLVCPIKNTIVKPKIYGTMKEEDKRKDDTVMYKRILPVALTVLLLASLTACAPNIITDEDTWQTAITAGPKPGESTTSKTEDTTSTEGTSSTTADTTTKEDDTTTSKSTSGTTSKTSKSLTTKSTTKSTTKTTTKSTTNPTTAPSSPSDLKEGYCSASSLYVRTGPGTNYESIGGLIRGDRVTITGRSGDWYIIDFNGESAYVSAQYISATPIE